MPKLTQAKKHALTSLLDDESNLVRRALVDEIKRYGEEGSAFLKGLTHDPNRILATHARTFLELLGAQDTVAHFRSFIRSTQYELETGCLLLDRTVYPTLEASEVCIFLDTLAARCREIMVLPNTPVERCKVLNRVLFHEYGFRGDVDHFYNPDNSFISKVIERRRGIPISLSIIYILVGQRCHLRLEPIGVPGRFMVGCFEAAEPFYIDVFERGCFRTAEDVKSLLKASETDDLYALLQPSTVGEVLCRCCRNLVNQYASENRESMVRIFTEFVHEFENTYSSGEQA